MISREVAPLFLALVTFVFSDQRETLSREKESKQCHLLILLSTRLGEGRKEKPSKPSIYGAFGQSDPGSSQQTLLRLAGEMGLPSNRYSTEQVADICSLSRDLVTKDIHVEFY